MEKLIKGLFITLCLLISYTAKAQSTSVDSLLCKEWKLLAFEEGGEKIAARKDQEKDRMIFYMDHKVKSIETDNIQNGIWQYDASLKKLTVIDQATKAKMTLKIITLTNNLLIVEMKDPNGIPLKIYMDPVIR